MKTKLSLYAAVAILFGATAIPIRLAAQDHSAEQGPTKKHHHYKLVDLGTFGGPVSYVNFAQALGAPNQINNHGMTVGAAATPTSVSPNCPFCGGIDGIAPFVFHAFEWRNGVLTDLGALPGDDNTSVATSISAKGEIVGHSENGLVDPLTGVREGRAVLWKEGDIRSLGTFGGNHSVAGNINSKGQVTGVALNAVPDPFSLFDLFLFGSSNGTQTRAFLWENGDKRDLGTLGGPDAFAGFVNELGEVMGFSYRNSTPNPTTGIPTLDPFLWRNGQMIDLGSLGGTLGGVTALNNRSQVIGQSNLAGDQISHPFLWEREKLTDLSTETIGGSPTIANAINDAGDVVGAGSFPGRPFDAYLWRDGVATDLGSLSGDCYSQAFAINVASRVVGQSYSCDFTSARPFLWEDGEMADLNTLIRDDENFRLVEVLAINDRGEIAGIGLPPGCSGQSVCGHAFVLIPFDGEDAASAVPDEASGSSIAAIPNDTTSITKTVVSVTSESLTMEIAARIRARFAQHRHSMGELPPWSKK